MNGINALTVVSAVRVVEAQVHLTVTVSVADVGSAFARFRHRFISATACFFRAWASVHSVCADGGKCSQEFQEGRMFK